MVFPDRSADTDWMRALADHYARLCGAHPDDELCVVFDIDGTILDLRHLVAHTLLAYDRDHGTRLFHGIVPDDITVSENQVDALLEHSRCRRSSETTSPRSIGAISGTRTASSPPALPTVACSA